MELECEHRKMLLDNLYKFQQQGTFTDVTLIINGQEFKAHRYILAATSTYFMAMFNNNMMESSSSVVKISGVETHAFSMLLRYMYTGNLDINEETISDILASAVYLQIDPVVNKCVEYLMNNIRMENCLDIMDIAHTYQLVNLRIKVYDFVSMQFMAGKDIVLGLDEDVIEYIVSRDIPINGSETDMLQTVVSWFLYGSHAEKKRKEQYTERILQHIHFDEISLDSFQNLLAQSFPAKRGKSSKLKEILCDMYNTSTTQKPTKYQHSTRGMKPAILRVGGFSRKGLTNEITYSFIDERHWRTLTTIPHVAQCNYGTAVLNNQLYIIGGCFNQIMFEVVHPNGFRYNPSTDSWIRIAAMKMDRCRFTLNVLNNKLYAVAGATTQGEFTNSAECYDSLTDSWKFIESLPQGRQQHAAVALEHQNTNLLFISGGLHQETVIASVFMYNEKTNTWTSCAPLLAPRADHVMFVYKNEIYVFGGWYTDPGRSIWCNNSRTQVPTIDVYNVQTNTWSHVTTVPTPRYHVGVVLHESKLYLIGGYHRSNDFKKHTVVECYDFATDTWMSDVKNEQNYWEHTNVVLYIPKYC